jgi:hypothetical protein
MFICWFILHSINIIYCTDMKHINFVLVFRYKGQFTLKEHMSCLSIKWENDYE